ncbi:MAG: FAD-dependent oxidoreductase, partial [Oscillospiraceae bacterium]|nr:FAD-dependent oxidoreductase [Oscillospiraceae bacterium]
DWPAATLDAAELNREFTARQQAATLMMKIKGIETKSSGDMNFFQSAKGVWGCWGGSAAYKNPNGPIAAFNNRHGPSGYMLKPVNAAQDGANSPHWWINAFLVFGVDGRAHSRDEGSAFYPAYMLSGTKSTDRAWIDARRFLHENRSQVEGALRSYPGFGGASLVYSGGYPEVGSVLYVRETVHMTRTSTDRANGTEDRNYAVGATASLNSGDAPNRGADAAYYASRIGLAMYYADVHPYKYTDLMRNTSYLWGAESWEKMRSDRSVTNPEKPQYPVYLPYACLTTDYVANLLIPGYGAGVSSYSWGEVRVFPNLCVLGDAAGIAAAYCINKNISALDIGWSATHIKAVQNDLVEVSARLEK